MPSTGRICTPGCNLTRCLASRSTPTPPSWPAPPSGSATSSGTCLTASTTAGNLSSPPWTPSARPTPSSTCPTPTTQPSLNGPPPSSSSATRPSWDISPSGSSWAISMLTQFTRYTGAAYPTPATCAATGSKKPAPRYTATERSAPGCWRPRPFVSSPIVRCLPASRRLAESLPQSPIRTGCWKVQLCILPSFALTTEARRSSLWTRHRLVTLMLT